MLRLYTQKMVPPRQEVPVWLNLPPIENRADLREAMKAVATGVAQGDIPSAQGLRLAPLQRNLPSTVRWLSRRRAPPLTAGAAGGR